MHDACNCDEINRSPITEIFRVQMTYSITYLSYVELFKHANTHLIMSCYMITCTVVSLRIELEIIILVSTLLILCCMYT